MEPVLHAFIDSHYCRDGAGELTRRLGSGEDPEVPWGDLGETALHVAARRRRVGALRILLEHGVNIDAKNAGGKTAYAHATRRGFDEVAVILQDNGADTMLTPADELAVLCSQRRFVQARERLEQHPGTGCTGNPEEDRLLADLAGREDPDPVVMLIAAGADLSATGLDDGTPLHQACWFGQPQNARLLLEAGAPIDVFDKTHHSSPIHWAVHGARFSGGAAARVDRYAEMVTMLLDAGSSLKYPASIGAPSWDETGRTYLERMHCDAPPKILEILRQRCPLP